MERSLLLRYIETSHSDVQVLKRTRTCSEAHGLTPFSAISKRPFPLPRLLNALGRVQKRSEAGEGDLMILLSYKSTKMNNDLNESLIEAARRNDLPAVKHLLSLGADIHTEDDYPLRVAAGEGHLEIVKFLIENGATVKRGWSSAPFLAALGGHWDVVNYLKEVMRR